MTIPNTVKFFGKSTFANCDNLKTIYIDSLEAWLNITFESSWGESLGNPLCNGGTLYIAGTPVKELSLPDNITDIPNCSFCNYKELKKVYLHDDLKTIGDHSFAGSTMLSMNCKNGWGVSKIPKSQTPLSIIINKKNTQNEIVEKIVACVDGGTNNLQALKIITGKDIDYSKYDSFILNGAKRFKLNAEGKLRAAMYRLRYQNELDASYRDEYITICQKGIKKIIPIAIEENDAEVIVLLFKVGAVLEKNKKAILKLLAASSNEKIKVLATTIDQAVAAYESNSSRDELGILPEEIEKTSPLSKEYSEKTAKECMIPYYRFRNREKDGIMIYDENFHETVVIEFVDCAASVARIDWHRHELNNEDRFEVTDFAFTHYNRQVNHIVAYLDKVTVLERIKKDDASVVDILNDFSLAQILEFISEANENGSKNCLALLLQEKNRRWPEYDGVTSLVLE